MNNTTPKSQSRKARQERRQSDRRHKQQLQALRSSGLPRTQQEYLLQHKRHDPDFLEWLNKITDAGIAAGQIKS